MPLSSPGAFREILNIATGQHLIGYRSGQVGEATFL